MSFVLKVAPCVLNVTSDRVAPATSLLMLNFTILTSRKFAYSRQVLPDGSIRLITLLPGKEAAKFAASYGLQNSPTTHAMKPFHTLVVTRMN